MSVKIAYVEKDDCTACNACADNLPKYFRMDDDGMAETHVGSEHVNEAPIPEDDQKKVQNEINDCPGECIHWKE